MNWKSVRGLVPTWRLVSIIVIARLSHWEVRGRWVGRRMVGRLVGWLNLMLVRGLFPYLVGRVIVMMSRGAVQILDRLVGRLFVMLMLGMMLRTMSRIWY